MLVLFCQTCCKGSTTYRKWITHLFSPIHQKRTRLKGKDWSKKEQSRAVVFTEFCKLNEKVDENVMMKLAWSVSEHTIISDLYFDCGQQVCVILIDEKKGAEYIVNNMDEIEAGSFRPFIQIATNISNTNWENIFKKGDKQNLPKNVPNILANEAPSKIEPVIEIDIEDSDDDDFVRQNLESVEKELAAENSFAEDISLENDFVIEDHPVLDIYNKEAPSPNGCDIETAMEVQNNSEVDIEEEFLAFMKENTLSREAVKTRKLVIRQLAIILQQYYKKAHLFPFEKGLEKMFFLKSSTIAVGIDIKERFKKSQSGITSSDMMKIRELLCSAKPDGNSFCLNLYKNIFQRGQTFNFTHYRSKIECECYFFLKLSQQKWNFVSACMDIDPRVLPLTNFLVCWYEKCLESLTDGEPENPNKFLVVYPFIQLVIYFLIDVGIVPSISIWRQNFSKNVNTKGVNVGFCEDKAKVLNLFEQSQKCVYSEKDINSCTGKPSGRCILGLAARFFEYFGNVDLENNIISLMAGLVGKSELNAIIQCPKKKKGCAASEKRELILNKMKLKKSYKKLLRKSASIKSTSFIIQDACDHLAYEFSPKWSETSLHEFQSLCCSTALEINNILSENSSLRDLWRYFLTDLKTDDLLLKKPCGFTSKRKVIKSTLFNFPKLGSEQINTSKLGVKKFWFHVLKKFIDIVFEEVLKFQVKSTYLEDSRETEQWESESDTADEEYVPVPKKKRKGNNGNVMTKQSSQPNSLQRYLSKVKVPKEGRYIKTYFVESRFSNCDPDLRNKIHSTISPLPEDPLELAKNISDCLQDDNLKDATEMTCKILIDCNVLVAGIQIEAPCSCDNQHATIVKLRDIISFFRNLGTEYTLYRLKDYSRKFRK